MIRLVEATDRHFAWLLGDDVAESGLTQPPGGVDTADTLRVVRGLVAGLHAADCRQHWLVCDDQEVQGSCGFIRPPDESGTAEIGYGIAVSRQGRGIATEAVRLMLDALRDQVGVRCLVAGTAVANAASQIVLSRNGFVRAGSRIDPEDGALVLWEKRLGA